MLPLQTRFRVNDADVAAEVFHGEAIILNLATGVYYSLDQAAGLIWTLLTGGHSLEETASSLLSRYDVQPSAPDRHRASGRRPRSREPRPDRGRATGRPGPCRSRPRAIGCHTCPRPSTSTETWRAMLALDPPMPRLDEIPWKDSDDRPGADETPNQIWHAERVSATADLGSGPVPSLVDSRRGRRSVGGLEETFERASRADPERARPAWWRIGGRPVRGRFAGIRLASTSARPSRIFERRIRARAFRTSRSTLCDGESTGISPPAGRSSTGCPGLARQAAGSPRPRGTASTIIHEVFDSRAILDRETCRLLWLDGIRSATFSLRAGQAVSGPPDGLAPRSGHPGHSRGPRVEQRSRHSPAGAGRIWQDDVGSGVRSGRPRVSRRRLPRAGAPHGRFVHRATASTSRAGSTRTIFPASPPSSRTQSTRSSLATGSGWFTSPGSFPERLVESVTVRLLALPRITSAADDPVPARLQGEASSRSLPRRLRAVAPRRRGGSRSARRTRDPAPDPLARAGRELGEIPARIDELLAGAAASSPPALARLTRRCPSCLPTAGGDLAPPSMLVDRRGGSTGLGEPPRARGRPARPAGRRPAWRQEAIATAPRGGVAE